MRPKFLSHFRCSYVARVYAYYVDTGTRIAISFGDLEVVLNAFTNKRDGFHI